MRRDRRPSWTSLRGSDAAAVVAAVVLPLVSSSALGDDFQVGDITVSQPWTRATPPGADVAGGYLVVRNAAAEPDRLVAATVEIAGRAELHEMAVADGVMRMRPLQNGVPIPSEGSVALEPGGYHLMFMELAGSLQEGESFAGTLTFENAGTLEITYDVAAIGAAEPPARH